MDGGETLQREPMVWAVAGMIFGFVLGYMVANAGSPAPVPRPVQVATPADAPENRTAAQSPVPEPLDPNELRALESLAARDKSNLQVRLELGNLLMDHARYEEAARWLREAVALKPDSPDALVDLGACLLNLGRPADALAEVDKALKVDPGHKKALFNKGLALMEGGRPRDAVAVWEDLLKRYPGDPQLAGLREQIDRVRAGGRPS
jgi:predicted Zn-dependent protease